MVCVAQAEKRTFSSKEGSKMTGIVTALHGDTVSLATEKGKLINFPKTSLSTDDQDWLTKNKGELWRDGLNKAKIKLSPSQHALNVVYFVPADREPIEGYKVRLSQLMIHLQQFYGKEMARNGMGPRSFGLSMASPTSVNIIVIKGTKPHTDYPYAGGGGGRVAKEVNAYFQANPKQKTSQHTLVIMPTWYSGNNGEHNPGGVPFYGMGKICFALDYKAFDIKHIGQKTKEGQLLTKWYGGLAHELGHGLNLPHNHATKTDQQNLGTALMGSGNYTFGMERTFITPASSVLLDACEVFAPKGTSMVFYPPGKADIDLKSFKVASKDGKIYLKGTYKSSVPVRSLAVFIEGPPYGVNQDYEAISFAEKLGKTEGGFSMTIPHDELIGLNNEVMQIRLTFVLENGNLVRKPFDLQRSNLISSTPYTEDLITEISQ